MSLLSRKLFDTLQLHQVQSPPHNFSAVPLAVTPKLSLPESLNNFASLSLTHRNLLSTILVGKGRQN